MKNIIRKDILSMESYIPVNSFWDVDVSVVEKLDAGENVYADIKSMQSILSTCSVFNYYPDATYKQLRKALAQYTKLDLKNIVVGAGSDELIDLILRVILNEGDEVINCPPTFGMYPIAAKLNRGKVISVPRKNNYAIDIDTVISSLTNRTKAIIVCSPNNPTGNVIDKKELVRLLQTKTLVLVDEAYVEFAKESVIDLLPRYKNLVILRTFSKWAGMAGLRFGYGLMTPFLAEQIMKVKSPYNVNVAAEAVALEILKNKKSFRTIIKKIIVERNKLVKKLQKIAGITVFSSETNFIYITVASSKIKNLRKLFLQDNIAVRYYENAIRVTVGKPEQNRKVINVLRKYFRNKNKYAFIDRDGTLIFEPQDTFQIDSIKKLQVLDGAIKGLKKLNKLGYELIMVTNQDGLGTTSFPQSKFDSAQNKLLRIFKENEISFKKIFICPHVSSDNCSCRKPKRGLVKEFIKENKIDKSNSFVCGDRESDKLFAKNLGVQFIPMQTNGNFLTALRKGKIV